MYMGQIYYCPMSNSYAPSSTIGAMICGSPALTYVNYATCPTGIVRNDLYTKGNPTNYLDVDYAGLFHIPIFTISVSG